MAAKDKLKKHVEKAKCAVKNNCGDVRCAVRLGGCMRAKENKR